MDIANTQILSGDFKKGSGNLSRLNITNGLSIAQPQRKKQNTLILQTLLSFQNFSDRLTTRTITELIQNQFEIMHDNEYRKLLQQIHFLSSEKLRFYTHLDIGRVLSHHKLTRIIGYNHLIKAYKTSHQLSTYAEQLISLILIAKTIPQPH